MEKSEPSNAVNVATQNTSTPRPLPPITGDTACHTCGCGSHDTMSMDALLGVGFGDCTVTKDGEQIYSEMEAMH